MLVQCKVKYSRNACVLDGRFCLAVEICGEHLYPVVTLLDYIQIIVSVVVDNTNWMIKL